jgi:hypothetical protein
MKRFIKANVMNKAKTTKKLFEIQITSEDVQCDPKDVDIGVAAEVFWQN